jgi:hypothetical protein
VCVVYGYAGEIVGKWCKDEGGEESEVIEV